jgi:hypothetical protein
VGGHPASVGEFDVCEKAFITALDDAVGERRKLHIEKFCMELASGLYY